MNGGLANTTNPCLATQLAWAQTSTGATSQPQGGPLRQHGQSRQSRVADWPRNNVDPVAGTVDSDPYGACAGADGTACAWQYGWNMADLDAQQRGVANPGSYRWWLDVETANSWESNTQNNWAALEGMVAYFASLGMTVGIYSTSYQWGQIAGTVPSTSSLYSPSDWVPGARSLAAAQSNGSALPLTAGGAITVTQWTGTIDGDYSCM